MQFSNPEWLWLFPPVVAWVVWLAHRSDASLAPWRRWLACALRLSAAASLILAMAGIQRLDPREGMNVMFLLDRSRSVPETQQEAARQYVNEVVQRKESQDQAGDLCLAATPALSK